MLIEDTVNKQTNIANTTQIIKNPNWWEADQLVIYTTRSRSSQLISESYNNSHNRVKITLQGGVTIFGVNITPRSSYFFP